jgi:hypothetical protein
MRLGLREAGFERVDYIELTQYRTQLWNFAYMMVNVKIP